MPFALAAVALAGALAHAEPRAATAQPIVFAATLASRISGEVYRVDANGRRIDLSRSRALDTSPVVSPDGKRVAFISDRAGFRSVYEVGSDGHGLRRIGPRLGNLEPWLSWQPHGNRIALVAGGVNSLTLWILQAGRAPRVVVRGATSPPAWSPDGAEVATGRQGRVAVYSPSGTRLWTAPAARVGQPSWSAGGLLAAARPGGGIAVYDEGGHERFVAAGNVAAWSPDGARLALLDGHSLVVLASSGARELVRAIPGLEPNAGAGLRWAGPDRVAIQGIVPDAGRSGIDLRTGRLWTPSSRWFATRSADGSLAIETPAKGLSVALRVVPTAGGVGTTYATLPGCYADGVVVATDSAQFVPGSRSLVYASSCPDPFDNLWSVAPDGSRLRRITNVAAEQAWPALSPDGTRLAYARARYSGLSCKGCPSGIHVVDADGHGDRALTNPPDLTYDATPTWSPDGTQILFSRSSATAPGELMVVPASGGAARDLHLEGDQPAWGPTRIAYTTANSTAPALWTANPDGSDPQKVATGLFGSPAWSADGRLAYLGTRYGATVIVGSTRTKLPFDRVTSLGWSPDGTRFVVTARTSRTAPFDVYTVATDGTGARRLTRDLDASAAGRR